MTLDILRGLDVMAIFRLFLSSFKEEIHIKIQMYRKIPNVNRKNIMHIFYITQLLLSYFKI